MDQLPRYDPGNTASTPKGVVRCPRCRGRRVTERDSTDAVAGFHTWVWKCLACGRGGDAYLNVGDPVTRASSELGLSDQLVLSVSDRYDPDRPHALSYQAGVEAYRRKLSGQ